MKLNFKDLKQQKFTIDAEPSDTIADVKQKVAAEKGFDAAQLRLIWSGKILQDANNLESYEIKPNDQIVCMQQKPKAAPVAKPAAAVPSTPASKSTNTATPAAPGPAGGSGGSDVAPAAAPATPSPAPATTATTQPASERAFNDSAPLMGVERESALQNMVAMGFDRAEAERAMRAAYFNPDRAIEYLLSGIPESAQQAVAPPAAAPPASGTSPSATINTPATTTQQDESVDQDEPVNLFEAAAAAASGRGGAAGAGGRGAGAGVGAGAGAGAGGAGGVGGGNNLEFLRSNPTFQQLRQIVQQNPQMLESVLQQVGASNPQLAQLISNNTDQFVQLLSEGVGEEGGDEGVPMPPGVHNISVTEAERDAIERLCRLGFSRDLAIQAYFACDKNEELAANYLFDNPEEDFGGGEGGGEH